MIELQFHQSPPCHSKALKCRAFYNFIKAKVHFQRESEIERERASTCMHTLKKKKEGPLHFTNVFTSPCPEPEWKSNFYMPSSPELSLRAECCLISIWGIFDFLIGLWKDTFICMGKRIFRSGVRNG